jgi:site-specific DNA-cytosine methylase
MPFRRIILSLCDLSGNWPKYYREAGYDVRQIDLKNGHDVRLLPYVDAPVYGILAAPPCTVFAASGARWPRTEDDYRDALAVVDACLRAVAIYEPKFWALENPVGRLKDWLGPPRMYFDPCEFGDPYTKKTALWGLFNVPVMTHVEPIEGSKMHRLSQSPRRAELRSMTPLGFAKAFF